MTILRGQRYRLYPTKEQEIFFNKTFGCCRKVYNLMLADRIADYQHKLTTGESRKLPTPARYKNKFPFLKEVDSLALANEQLNLQKAFKNFYEQPRVGFPRWKSKGKCEDTYTTNNQKGTIAIMDSYVKLPKIGKIKAKIHRTIDGVIKSATIRREPSGDYYISVLFETLSEVLPKTFSSIGIDVGITELAILSSGKKYDNHKFYHTSLTKLKKEQKRLSKMREIAKSQNRDLSESSNYQKQKRKVARLHQKIRNQRNDFLHQTSAEIIKNHDIICLEDLGVKGLMKNRKMSKAIADVSWGRFTTMLEYKAEWCGRTIQYVDRWFPSSQLCSTCGANDGKKALDIRQWKCQACNTDHDRDINAAVNIKIEGLRLLQQQAA